MYKINILQKVNLVDSLYAVHDFKTNF